MAALHLTLHSHRLEKSLGKMVDSLLILHKLDSVALEFESMADQLEEPFCKVSLSLE